VRRGSVVIDNSATFRMREDVPLVVPEINAATVGAGHRIFPVANCTAIVLCMALAPVRDVAGLRSVRVATYQAVSGAGRAALDAFDRGEGEVVGNVVPRIGDPFDEAGESGEERKVREETRKILALPELTVSSTCVRVPVRTAHSEAVFFETERETSLEELAAAFERSASVVFHREGIVTPREVEGKDEVHVARLRAETGKRNFALWCVGDQLRKGAATNAVQILELLLARGYLR
jgi:aspartate-semialdehyde dehydrogenase